MPQISELFHLKYGHSLELNRLEQIGGPAAINFVGRAARNNGVTAKVRRIEGLEPAASGTVSVALGGQGGAGIAFLQPFPYYCGRDVMILTPKHRMHEQEILWWVTCISANRFRFGFGRQANRTLKDINLPSRKVLPRWVSSVDFGKRFEASLNQLKELSVRPPDTLATTIGEATNRVCEIFDVDYGTSLELNRLTRDSAGTNFIARTARNNGITAKIIPPDGVAPIAGECISVAVSGSVLEAFVQKEPFLTGFHVMVLRPKFPMCTEELMFYATCVRENRWRYNYGRQANRTLKDLMVPARSSLPAWVYGSFARIADRLIREIQA